MRFSVACGMRRCGIFTALVVFGLGLLCGCDAKITAQGDVLDSATRRVGENLLPELLDETTVVSRNFFNLLTALPEFCTTPLAEFGAFVSSLPALQQAIQDAEDQPRLDDNRGAWLIAWRNVAFGDEDGVLTVDTATDRFDVDLAVFFLSPQQATQRAVPFRLVSQGALLTAGEPPSFANGTQEGFFLSQDATTGVWTLRWRAVGTTKVFSGRINDVFGITRVIRRLSDGDVVTSLEVNDAQTQIEFSETTAPDENKGITFFVRPGERVQFRLELGPSEENLSSITRAQLRIGGQDQALPATSDMADFTLISNLPLVTVGQPALTPGSDLGLFVWQDTETTACGANEAQWRMRFSTAEDLTTIFAGEVRGEEIEDSNRVALRATPVGGCPTVETSDADATFTYTCTLTGSQERGYDICTAADARLQFEPEVNSVRDPGLVFIGPASAAPPSPEPFSILFELEIEDPTSSEALRFFDATVVLSGNNPADGTFQLNPDQLSNDPLCQNPGEQVQPRVRLTGVGNYATPRFEGSRYTLEEVGFTDPNVTSLTGVTRFPDRGNVLLQTRIQGEDTDIVVFMRDITARNGVIQSLLDVEILVEDVLFEFPNERVDLSVD